MAKKTKPRPLDEWPESKQPPSEITVDIEANLSRACHPAPLPSNTNDYLSRLASIDRAGWTNARLLERIALILERAYPAEPQVRPLGTVADFCDMTKEKRLAALGQPKSKRRKGR